MLGMMVSVEAILTLLLVFGLTLWGLWNWVRYRMIKFRTPSTPSVNKGTTRKAKEYGIATNVFFTRAFAGFPAAMMHVIKVGTAAAFGLIVVFAAFFGVMMYLDSIGALA